VAKMVADSEGGTQSNRICQFEDTVVTACPVLEMISLREGSGSRAKWNG
jgi:hypothetical protein